MPLHDWTLVEAWAWHSFELSWRCALSAWLNNGGLPKSHFVMTETLELRPPTGFSEMKEPEKSRYKREDELPEMEPPQGIQQHQASRLYEYATSVMVVRDSNFHSVVAAIYISAKQDAKIPYRKRALVESAVGAVTRGIHVVMIELHGDARDPSDTIAESVWRELGNSPWERSVEFPFTLVSFHCQEPTEVYLDQTKAGLSLTAVPLFLSRDTFVPLPLEETYLATWELTPEPIRNLILGTESA
jgi:hypothetical protein